MSNDAKYDTQSGGAGTPKLTGSSKANIGEDERVLSLVGGGLLTLYGLSRRSPAGILLLGLGGYLAYRGVTGHDPVFRAIGLDRSGAGSQPAPVVITETLTVNKPSEELYAFWRDFEHLPQFMKHVKSVRHLDERTSMWEAGLPKSSRTIKWRAEVIDEKPGEYIRWRSLDRSDVYNAGEVRFRQLSHGRGTEVKARIEYRPPAGRAGGAVAGLLNPIFAMLVKEDIRRFKNLMEAGEIPTTHGQPAGR